MEATHADETNCMNFESITKDQPMSYYLQPINNNNEIKTVVYFMRPGSEQSIAETLNY